ncbi:MAG TPA: diguanylate cyclase, partial [Nitrospiria bacterium]|nr:diguanylate cyclase [Nitrospiria bacterium]
PLIMVEALILAIVIGILDYRSGVDVSLMIFYLVPIFIAAWCIGNWAGILLALGSSAAWFFEDVLSSTPHSHPLIPYWNAAVKIGFFLIIAWLMSSFKNTWDLNRKLARTDDLTGAINRRFFFELASLELSRAGRYRHPLTVAYIDLDRFKMINDRFGHAAGDSLLRSVIQTIRGHIRDVDVIARLGGDEFVLMMPETGYESAESVIFKIRNGLQEMTRMEGWPVTFSIGAVTFYTMPASLDKIMKMADELMYSVKKSGRDNVRHLAVDRPRQPSSRVMGIDLFH